MTAKIRLLYLLRMFTILILLIGRRENVCTQIVDQRWTNNATLDEKQQQWLQADSILSVYAKKGIQCRRADILQNESSSFLLPDGTFDVFFWEKQQWKNLYKGIFYGYNRGAKKFSLDGTLYSFGGYGYWYQNSHLIRFDFAKGEWELVYATNLKANGIFSLDHHYLTSYGNDCDRLDLEILKVKHLADCGFSLKEDSVHNHTTLEFKSYTLNLAYHVAIQKSMQQIFEFSHTGFPAELQVDMVLETIGDSLIWWGKPEHKSTTRRYEKQKSTSVALLGAPGSKMIPSSSIHSLLNYMILLGLILLIFLAIWYLKSKVGNDSHSENQETDELSFLPIINTLVNVAHKPLSVEALDKIFGIHTLTSQDTQRYKRAQLIREVNTYYLSIHGRELIQRRPDPDDGRKYIYMILPV
jgi:hypothetical protein